MESMISFKSWCTTIGWSHYNRRQSLTIPSFCQCTPMETSTHLFAFLIRYSRPTPIKHSTESSFRPFAFVTRLRPADVVGASKTSSIAINNRMSTPIVGAQVLVAICFRCPVWKRGFALQEYWIPLTRFQTFEHMRMCTVIL